MGGCVSIKNSSRTVISCKPDVQSREGVQHISADLPDSQRRSNLDAYSDRGVEDSLQSSIVERLDMPVQPHEWCLEQGQNEKILSDSQISSCIAAQSAANVCSVSGEATLGTTVFAESKPDSTLNVEWDQYLRDSLQTGTTKYADEPARLLSEQVELSEKILGNQDQTSSQPLTKSCKTDQFSGIMLVGNEFQTKAINSDQENSHVHTGPNDRKESKSLTPNQPYESLPVIDRRNVFSELDHREILETTFEFLCGNVANAEQQTNCHKEILLRNLNNLPVVDNFGLVAALKKLDQAKSISFSDFEHIVSKETTYVKGHRIQWASNLLLDHLLAKQLAAGTVFDGLSGLKQMSEPEVLSAFQNFCKEAENALIRAWRELKTPAPEHKKHQSNSKFALMDGTSTGTFGSLDEFYDGVESRIGYPNPKLLQAIRREHTERGNAKKFFVAPNYGVCTCPDWEWHWVNDPSAFSSRNYKYPGEEGDSYVETEVTCSTETTGDFVKVFNSSAIQRVETLLASREIEPNKSLGNSSDEAIARGIRIERGNSEISIIFPYRLSDDFPIHELRKEISETLEAETLGFVIRLKKKESKIYTYTENPDPRKEQRQSRTRISLENLMKLEDIDSKVKAANLQKEEVRCLRQYTGPMYFQYNDRLRKLSDVLWEIENRFETTIFTVISGIIKLSRISSVPSNRTLYRGLGGMSLPDNFWREKVEYCVEFSIEGKNRLADVNLIFEGLEVAIGESEHCAVGDAGSNAIRGGVESKLVTYLAREIDMKLKINKFPGQSVMPNQKDGRTKTQETTKLTMLRKNNKRAVYLVSIPMNKSTLISALHSESQPGGPTGPGFVQSEDVEDDTNRYDGQLVDDQVGQMFRILLMKLLQQHQEDIAIDVTIMRT